MSLGVMISIVGWFDANASLMEITLTRITSANKNRILFNIIHNHYNHINMNIHTFHDYTFEAYFSYQYNVQGHWFK